MDDAMFLPRTDGEREPSPEDQERLMQSLRELGAGLILPIDAPGGAWVEVPPLP